jgi:hypothetical protein
MGGIIGSDHFLIKPENNDLRLSAVAAREWRQRSREIKKGARGGIENAVSTTRPP